MVYISKVYTKFGDAGETMLASGETVSKASRRVRASGEIDELNATIGLVLTEIERAPATTASPMVEATLLRVQQELFDLGAELSTVTSAEATSPLAIETCHVEGLEIEIDALNAGLAPLRSFILPGGGPPAAAAHLARTVCRRAERTLVELAQAEVVGTLARVYLNRLSDYLFVASRALALASGHGEVLWNPARDRRPPTRPPSAAPG